MKIAMIMDTPFPPDARVENEAKALIERGHEICLFHIDYEKRPESEVAAGIHITRKRGGWWLYKFSALVYTLPIFRWWISRSLKDFLERQQPDVLHIHDMVIAETVMKVNRRFSLPVVLDLHENRPEIMKMYRHVKRLPGRWLIRLERWKKKQRELMMEADHVILVTEEARRVAEQDGIPAARTTAVPNVVPIHPINPYLPEAYRTEPMEPMAGSAERAVNSAGNGFELLYIGDTSLRRGTLTALEAVSLLKREIPRLHLRLVGSSSEDSLLKTYTKKQGLEDRVTFEGWRRPEELPRFVQRADLCLSPLLRNLHHDTTYANKLFQYMAGGKPVVVSDCRAQAAVVRRESCGEIHKAGDAADLARKILTLYQQPGSRERMGRNSVRAVEERWNWRVAAKSLQKVYESIEGGGRTLFLPLLLAMQILFTGCDTTASDPGDAGRYIESGIASWYGEDYHGGHTASGEIYHMERLTAAHPWLPFNTYVRVINQENGQSVIVRINDRGPFVEGRVIDLSRRAAREIGIVFTGLAEVELYIFK